MTELLRLGAHTWRARLPGLGEVSVDSKGGITVETAPCADVAAERTLREGWGEPLSWLRRGRLLIKATTIQDPETGLALALAGREAHQQAMMMVLLDQGWAVVADSITPVIADHESPLAEPRVSRVVTRRRLAVKHETVVTDWPRPGGNAVCIDVRRAREPARIAGVVTGVDRGTASRIADVPGFDRVRRAQGLLLDINRTVHDPHAVFALTTALARSRMARLEIERNGDAESIRAAVAGIIEWWRGLRAGR